jgi:hypothetical protein
MTPEELRLECLKLVQNSANASGLLLEPSQIISRARTYADFVMNWHGHGGAESVSGATVPEVTLEDGSRRRSPPVSQFESGANNGGLHGADAE